MRSVKTNSRYQRTLSITAPITVAVFILLPSSHTLAQHTEKKENTRNIEALSEKIHSLNRLQIAKIDRILLKTPTHPRRPDLIFQKANLIFEQTSYKHLAKRQQWLDCLEHQQRLRLLDKCDHPTPDYTTAVKVYQELLEQHPSFHTAMTLYRIADGLTESGKPSEAMPILMRLFREYPQFERQTDAYSILDTIITTDWAHQRMVDPKSWLGIRLESTQPSPAVVKVLESSPAHKYDLKPHDRITHIGDVPIKTKDHARLLVAIEPPGKSLKLTIRRGSKLMTVNIQTITRPSQSTLDAGSHSPAQ